MTLKERYYGKNPHGTMHYTNTMGIVVWFPDDNDKFDCDIVSANWCLDHGYSNFRKHKINYTAAGRGYFYKNKRKVYTDEIMRVNF